MHGYFMSKKISSQFEKECPICGGKIWGRGQKVLIEGAKITVCQSCAQYGVKIKMFLALVTKSSRATINLNLLRRKRRIIDKLTAV